MFSAILWFVFILYVVVWVLYARDFFYNRNVDNTYAQRWLGIALMCHGAFIVYMVFDLKRIPLATMSETFGTFVWLTAAIYWILERRLRDYSMGTFILPIFVIMMAISSITFHPDAPISEILEDVRFEVHVLSLLLAYGAFALSFIASLLHVLLARELRKRDLGVFYSRLPSLPYFEKISDSAVDIGFVFGTLGLIFGIYNAFSVWESFLFSDPKFIAAFINLLIYGIHVSGRRLAGWRGQRAAIISIVGFVWLLFSFIVISMLFTRIHNFM